MGKLNEAMKYVVQSAALKRKCLGENDISVSDLLVEIEIILYYQGNLDGALDTFKEAHNIVSKDISNSDDSGHSSNNIACVYFAMDDIDSANLYLRKALVEHWPS